ncbi:MAG UNVERIFIED_CONTAM: hypothetical protein LVR18_02995 [Planctomycetaceae bacterium]
MPRSPPKSRPALEGLIHRSRQCHRLRITRCRFHRRIHQRSLRTNVTGLTVSTNATLAGSLAATQSAASVTGVSGVQSITLTRLPVERPTVATNVAEVVTGFAGTGQITAIRIAAAATAAGHYTLTYNGQSRSIRWAQNNVTMNATRIGDALQRPHWRCTRKSTIR